MKELQKKIGDFNVVPSLAIIKIGDNPDSDIYVARKLAFAKKIGIRAFIVDFGAQITQEILLDGIEKLNKDKSVHGIIIQSPLPAPLDWAEAVRKISPEKDVDGMHGNIVPATARGVLTLLNYYKIPVAGKKVVVMGRSALVGGPIAELLKKNGAEVAVVHSQTVEPEKITRTADILVVAIGKPELVGAEYVREGQVVVDVGITSLNRPFNRPRRQNGTPSSSDEGDSSKPTATVVGDVDFDSVKDIVSAISPVPGGVGPMTVASLFQNLVEATTAQIH